MKRRIIITLVMIIFFSFIVRPQTVNTVASAEILEGLILNQTADLNFGTMTVPTGNVNIILNPINNLRTASNGNIVLLLQAPVHHFAAYTIYGRKNKHYNITLPNNNIVIVSSGSNYIHVNNFTFHNHTLSGSNDGKLNNIGTDNFTVGATIVLLNGQSSGNYTGTFQVTINYN